MDRQRDWARGRAKGRLKHSVRETVTYCSQHRHWNQLPVLRRCCRCTSRCCCTSSWRGRSTCWRHTLDRARELHVFSARHFNPPIDNNKLLYITFIRAILSSIQTHCALYFPTFSTMNLISSSIGLSINLSTGQSISYSVNQCTKTNK